MWIISNIKKLAYATWVLCNYVPSFILVAYDGLLEILPYEMKLMNCVWTHLCKYRLNWARITSWGWWDEWDATSLQTQDSKFEPWRFEAEHATYRSQRLPTVLNLSERGKTVCFFETWRPESGSNPRSSTLQTGRCNHCTRAPRHITLQFFK